MNDNVIQLVADAPPSPTDGTALFRKLINLGYAPIPIIPHEKTPGRFDPQTTTWRGLPGWQHYLDHPPSAKTLATWESTLPGNAPGVGILTGTITPVDGDITHPGLASAVITAAKDILGDSPYLRIGKSPKFMLCYRIKDKNPIPKMKSAVFDLPGHPNQAVEILGKGQQFVAYGFHPATNKPYAWPRKSLIDTRLEDLPAVSAEQLKTFLETFEFIAGDFFNGTRKNLGTASAQDIHPHTNLADGRGLAAEAVRSLSPNLAEEYHSWVRVGHAIKAAFPDDEPLALELFHEFSAKCEDKYDPEQTEHKFATLHPQRIGAGTLYRLAKESGWAPPRPLAEDEFESVDGAAVTLPWWFPPDVGSLPPRDWVVKRYFLRGNVTAIIAPGGVGKSSWVVSAALEYVSGSASAGINPHRKGKVMIINNEDDADEMSRRLVAVARHFNIPETSFAGKIKIRSREQSACKLVHRNDDGGTLLTPAALELIEDIKTSGIDLLVVDPLISIHNVDENDNTKMEKVMDALRTLALRAGCAVGVVHHSSKPPGGSSEGRAGNADSSRGATAIINAARIAFTLYEISAKDGKDFGIKETERHRYIRLDDAKANMHLKSGEPKGYYRESVDLPNGDQVGVLVPVALKRVVEIAPRNPIGEALENCERLSAAGNKGVYVADLVDYLQERGAVKAGTRPSNVPRTIERALESPHYCFNDAEVILARRIPHRSRPDQTELWVFREASSSGSAKESTS